MKPETITLYCVENARGEVVHRDFDESLAHVYADTMQRQRGRTPADRMHVVAREFVAKVTQPQRQPTAV